MKYLVFGGDSFYPGGGMDDFLFDSDSLEAAKKRVLDEGPIDWIQIVELSTYEIICERHCDIHSSKTYVESEWWEKEDSQSE